MASQMVNDDSDEGEARLWGRGFTRNDQARGLLICETSWSDLVGNGGDLEYPTDEPARCRRLSVYYNLHEKWIYKIPFVCARYVCDELSRDQIKSLLSDTDKNMKARESWKESNALGAFGRRIVISPCKLLIYLSVISATSPTK